MLESRKRGPMSGVGQYLVRHERQETKRVVRHRSPGCTDVPLVGVERSDIDTQTTELGHERWIPYHTPIISKGGAYVTRVHACGVDDAYRRNTSIEPLEKIRPSRSMF